MDTSAARSRYFLCVSSSERPEWRRRRRRRQLDGCTNFPRTGGKISRSARDVYRYRWRISDINFGASCATVAVTVGTFNIVAGGIQGRRRATVSRNHRIPFTHLSLTVERSVRVRVRVLRRREEPPESEGGGGPPSTAGRIELLHVHGPSVFLFSSFLIVDRVRLYCRQWRARCALCYNILLSPQNRARQTPRHVTEILSKLNTNFHDDIARFNYCLYPAKYPLT